MLAFRSRLPPIAAAALVLSLGCRDATEPTAFEPAGTSAAASAPLTFRQISEGSDYTCGVSTTDLAYCWGINNLGQLGNGTVGGSTAVPVAVSGGHRFRRVELGGGHACGVTTSDRAYCWGWNNNGQLGDGTRDDRALPVAVAGGLRFRLVSAGQYHTCGVTTDDRAYCWGYNRQGQAGDGSELARHKRPVQVDGGRRYRMVSAGGLHSCGVTTDDRAFCWGLGSSGQLGNNKLVGSRVPTAVAGGLAFLRVFAGETQRGAGYHSCGVATDQRAHCWGANLDGQLGDGTTTTRSRPTVVAGGIQFANVNPGADHTCGVSTGNVGYCWGYNYYGALGDGGPLGTGGPHPAPIAVTGGLALSSVTVGRVHSCGVTTDGAGWCWGGNTAGQLGDGAPDFATSTPRAVVGPD